MDKQKKHFLEKYFKGISKRNVLFLLKLFFALLMVWYLVHRGFLTRGSVLTLTQINTLHLVFLAGLSFFLSVVLSATRLMTLLRLIDISVGFWHSVKLTLIGFFFNLVLPGVIGGDVVKGFYLMKAEHQHKGRSTGIVVIDRILGVFGLMTIGLAAIIYLLLHYRSSLSAYSFQIFFSVLVLSGISLFLFLSMFLWGNNLRIRKKIQALLTAIVPQGIVYNMIESIGMLVTYPRIIFRAFFLSLCIHIISLLGILILSRMIDVPLPNAATLFAIFALILLFGIVPVTPGNVGWTELLASHSLLAIGSSAGAEIFLYWRIITVLCSLPGGLLYLVTTKDKKSNFLQQSIPSAEVNPSVNSL